MVLDFYAKTNNLGEIFLYGDLNARTADKNPEHEELLDHTRLNVQESSPMISNTKSRDARGKLLLDFLSSANMSLSNSSVIGAILGECTSVNYRAGKLCC